MLIDQYRKLKKKIKGLQEGNLIKIEDIWDMYTEPRQYSYVYDLHIDVGHQIVTFNSVYLTDVTTSAPVNGGITEEYTFMGTKIDKGVTLNRADYNDSWWLYKK